MNDDEAVYLIGDGVRLENTWRVPNVSTGALELTDPTTVTLRIEHPDGTVTSYTYAGAQVTKASTGRFYYDFVPTTPGQHTYRWEGTGAAQGAEEGTFTVRASQVI